MSGKAMEKFYRFTFMIAIILAILVVIGFFLLAIKIILVFSGDVQILGIVFSPASATRLVYVQ